MGKNLRTHAHKHMSRRRARTQMMGESRQDATMTGLVGVVTEGEAVGMDLGFAMMAASGLTVVTVTTAGVHFSLAHESSIGTLESSNALQRVQLRPQRLHTPMPLWSGPGHPFQNSKTRACDDLPETLLFQH